MEKMALIDLALPSLGCFDSVPGEVIFGRHRAMVQRAVVSQVTKTKDADCGGSLRVHAHGGGEIRNCSCGEPISVFCSKCSFSSVISNVSWHDAVLEWARMVFACGLFMLPSQNYFSSSQGRAIHLLWDSGPHSLKSFLPELVATDEKLESFIPALYGKHSVVPIWPAFRMAVARLEGLETFECLGRWGFISAVLMRDLEERFQDGIDRARRTVVTVSEVMHPATRRY